MIHLFKGAKRYRYTYTCLWSKVEPQGINGLTINDLPSQSWGKWIPAQRKSRAEGVPGYQGSLNFSFEDFKVCHYEFADRAQSHDHFYTEEAFGIWELTDG